jgi:hypothetical protein
MSQAPTEPELIKELPVRHPVLFVDTVVVLFLLAILVNSFF